jgi:hypothetical protein
MINNFWYIGQKGSFKETRGARIGASDCPYLFPDPERPTESLAAFTDINGKKQPNTALDLWKKKTGEEKKFTNSYPARIGHTLEDKALEFFIERFFDKKSATILRIRKQRYENDLLLSEITEAEAPNPEHYQYGLFRHNTEYYFDGMIVHPDLIYLGNPDLLKAPKKGRYITVEGITVDLAKPFYLEAKSARKEATKRRNESFVKGYDFDLTNWQGIPLKHYVQMQFQSAVFQIDTGYLPLLHNTSEFQVWRVDKDKKWQARIINTVGKMLKYIEMKVPPKEMAINLADIISLYPNLRNDFITVTGDKAEKIKEICKEAKKAVKQIKNWEAVKKDCGDALSVYMTDYDEIKDGSDTLVKWKKTKGRESIGVSKEITGKLSFLKYLKLNDKTGYNYLFRKGWLKTGKDSRSVDIKWKG